MLRPGINLKLGVPLFLVAFVVSGLALYGGAQLVKQDQVSADDGAAVDDGAPAGGPASFNIVAENIQFDVESITVSAGVEVTVTLDNRDAGVPHNIAFYTDSSASQLIAGTEVENGPVTQTLTFTAPTAPGTYFFRCDVHPDTMTGALVVQ